MLQAEIKNTIFEVINTFDMPARLKTISRQVTRNNFVDADTGAILETDVDVKETSILVNNREDFAIISVSIMGVIDDLDKISIKLLVWCALNAELNENIIHLTRPMCDIITEKIGISYQTIKNTTTKLSKKGILIRIGSGAYRIHPKYFWRGDMTSKNRVMKHVLKVEMESN